MRFLDLIFSAYHTPMKMLNGMIQTYRFAEFCNSFIDMRNHEKEEKTMWEFYLHKVFDNISFDDFIQKNRTYTETIHQSIDLSATINESRSMMDDFVPE